MEVEVFPCPIYAKAWNDLISQIDEAKHLSEKICIYAKFAEKYTLLPRYWAFVLDGVGRINSGDKNIQKLIKSSDRFYYLYSPECVDRPFKHIEFKYPGRVRWSLTRPFPSPMHVYKQAERYLRFPHHRLYDIYKAYMSTYPKPLAKDLILCYKKNKSLYSRILKCEENIDEWLHCIKEIDDKEVVIANFELKIGQNRNWANKKLWDSYFKFLKENNRKEILEVYRKYTRLFISDKKAVEEYRNEIEKFSMWNMPTSKYWLDTVKFEMDFDDLKFAYCLLKHGVKAVLGRNVDLQFDPKIDLMEKLLLEFRQEMEEMEFSRESVKESLIPTSASEPEESTPTSTSEPEESIPTSTSESEPESESVEVQKEPVFFTTKNAIKQSFPFRQSFIQYLLEKLKTANGFVLLKLFQTCKFFYPLQPIPLCYQMIVSLMDHGDEGWKEGIIADDGAAVQFSKVHLYGRLWFNYVMTQTLLSAIIQKLHRCDVYSINISFQRISLGDFEFLLSDNLMELRFNLVTVYDDQKEAISGMALFEIVTKNCPKLEYFRLITDQDYIIFLSDKELNCFKNVNRSSFDDNRPFQNVFIDGVDVTISELQKWINNTEIQNFTLKDASVIDDENRDLMTTKEVVEFLKAKVPTNASVCYVFSLREV